MKKIHLVWAVLILAAVCAVGISRRDQKADNWTHKTFQGTVTDISNTQEGTLFSVALLGSGSEKDFLLDDQTIYAIDFQVGDAVIVESDYNTREHDGMDVPYPAAMITGPSITDQE